MLEGGQVDMQAEEVEEHVGVDLSVGVVGKEKRSAEALPIFCWVWKWWEICRAGWRWRGMH